MKILSAILVTVSTSVLVRAQQEEVFAPNKLCGGSADCQRNCLNGDFHIVVDDNDSGGAPYFGCVSRFDNFANPDCQFGLSDVAQEQQQSIDVCESVGGKYCPIKFKFGAPVNYCLILQPMQANYTQACEASNGTVHNHNTGSYSNLASDCGKDFS